MRTNVRSCALGAAAMAVAAMLSASVPCHAADLLGLFQRKEKPVRDYGKDKLDVPQWGLDAAKTPTPKYGNDAVSVILYDETLETVDEQGRAVERERWARRILKPQARNSTCGVTFDVDEKVKYFHAWTVTDTHNFQARENDFFEVGGADESVMLFTEKAIIVHPLAADVGATVICETEKSIRPYWREAITQIQTSVPVVLTAFEIDLPQGVKYAVSFHKQEPVKPVEVAPNHFRWEFRDQPALDLREIKHHPNRDALDARMSVMWGDLAAEGKDAQWRALGQWTSTLQTHRPDPTPEITKQTQSLIAGATDYFAKLQLISEYVQKNVRYFIVERGIGGWQAHYAGDIYRNRYGDCKDKATITISMLQAAGIDARYVVVDTERGVVDADAPSNWGNHMITAIVVPPSVKDDRLKAISTGKDGQRYLIFDPTNQETPIGNLPDYLQGGYGILAAGDKSQVLALPVLGAETNGAEQKGVFTLAEDGSIHGVVDASSVGNEGGEYRAMVKQTEEKERREYWESELARTLPGVTLKTLEVKQPASLSQPLTLHYEIAAAQFAHTAGQLLLIRPRVLGTMARPLDEKPRTVPIELGATGRWSDSFDVTLPAGYKVDELPDPVQLDMDFASYHASVKFEGGKLHYERELVMREVELPAARAAEYRKLQSVILRDEKGTAVLKKQ